MYHRQPWGKSALLVSPYPSSKSISTCHVEMNVDMRGNSCTSTSSPSFFGPIRFFFLNKFPSSAFHPRDVQPTPRPPPKCWAMATDLAPEGPIEWEAQKNRHRTWYTWMLQKWCSPLPLGASKVVLCSPLPLGGCCGEIPIDVLFLPKKILPNVRL